MRVAIDARKLHDFGIGTYIRNLLTQLARIDRSTDYLLLCQEADLGVAAELGPNFRSVLERSPPYSLREQIHIPWVARREGADLYHAPHYVLPVAMTCRSVVTIHDCIHLVFPQYLPSRAASVYARAVMGLAARRAHRILTVSEASKRDILRFFDVPAEKIEVTYNAIDDRFWTVPPDEALAHVRERYGLDQPFLLYAGNIKPHKNLVRLIEAFDRLRARGRGDLLLVIAGDELSMLPTLERAVDEHRLRPYVRVLGYVPDDTLAILYRLANVFVFPSLYEGFGLPPLEAMASGTPVVTSNVSSLPEITGDAALLVDPYDVQAIADGIERVLDDAALADQMRGRGLVRARAFSWAAAAKQTRAIYQAVGGL